MKLLISIDVEAHRTKEEIGERDGSLAMILGLLSAHGVKATFFVDTCEAATWGSEYIREVCERIASGGHELALHAHPHHFTGEHGRWLLNEYSPEEQEKILSNAIDEYVKAVGRHPVLFRAGGFGANSCTLSILKKRGIKRDSSLLLWHKDCDIQPQLKNENGTTSGIDGVVEFPLTPVVMLSLFGKRIRSGALDFNWMPGFFIKRTLAKLERQGGGVVVLLMHSSSLTRRVSSTAFVLKPSLYAKLDRLLQHIKASHYEISTFEACDELDAAAAQRERSVYWEKNPFIQFALLFYQSHVGKGHSRRLAYFYWSVVSIFVGFLCFVSIKLV